MKRISILSFCLLSIIIIYYFVSPANTSPVEGVVRAYNRQFYDNYFVIKNWEKGFDEYESSLEPYAERGTIAWAIGPYLEAEVLMYKATRDPLYLNRAIDLSDKVLALRDSVSGRVNYFGESPPVWSAGSRYGWGESIIKNNRGKNILKVLVYGTWEAETGIVGNFRDGNDFTYISLAQGTKEDTFKVTIENEKLNIKKSYDNLNLQKEGIINDDKSVKITVLSSSQDLPEFKTKQPIGNILIPYTVHTGLILKPVIDLVQIIRGEKLNSYYQSKADIYLQACIDAVNYHQFNWVDIDSEKGYYAMCNYDGTIGRVLPWNQMFELAIVTADLTKITGEIKYRNISEKIANYFKSTLVYDPINNSYIWRYWDWEGYMSIEKTDYAIIDCEFVYKMYGAGITFTDTDMERFTNTLCKSIFKKGGTISYFVDGNGDLESKDRFSLALVNYWSEWGDKALFYRPVEWLERELYSGNYSVTGLLATARCIYQKKINDKNYLDPTNIMVGKYRTDSINNGKAY